MSEPLPIASISIQNDPHLTDVPLLSSPLLYFCYIQYPKTTIDQAMSLFSG